MNWRDPLEVIRGQWGSVLRRCVLAGPRARVARQWPTWALIARKRPDPYMSAPPFADIQTHPILASMAYPNVRT